MGRYLLLDRVTSCNAADEEGSVDVFGSPTNVEDDNPKELVSSVMHSAQVSITEDEAGSGVPRCQTN